MVIPTLLATVIGLTEAFNWSSGSIWYKKPIDLSKPFKMELDVMMGCKNEDGADGIVFIFHPSPRRLGYAGEGMGFAGLVPSLGIEIDTWENDHLGDPAEDHVALLKHGRMSHYYGLTPAKKIKNLEDCKTHKLEVDWTPVFKYLSIKIDGIGVLYYNGDIVEEVFYGEPVVYWGISSATGGYNNKHEVCFERLEFEIPVVSTLTSDNKRKLLNGEMLALENILFESGSSELKPSSYPELEDLYKFLKDNPELGMNIYGHTDSAGASKTNEQLSERRAKTIFDYLKGKGIDPDRMNISGQGEAYPRDTNRTAAGRKNNRRIEIYMFKMFP